MNNSVYSAAEGTIKPKFYLKSGPPQFPVTQPKIEPPQNKFLVSYAPQIVTYTNLMPIQSTVTIPQIDSQPILLNSTNVLPPINNTYHSPMIYSTLQNIIPKLDDLDSKKINKDFDFNTHYELEFKREPNLFPYLGIRKKNIPLFGHLELPQEYNYTSPSLSSDMRYLACIARVAVYIVFFW